MAEAMPLRGWSFSAASYSPLNCGTVLTQGFALGWDMAAPLALSEGKNNSNDKYGGFSTALRSGRNDGLW